MNPTDKAHWSPRPNIRNAYRTMVPLACNGPWSQALGPTHFSWMFMDETPHGLPRVEPPDVWFVYRTNPAISFWDTQAVGEKMARFPFVVAFAYTRDETNHFAMHRVALDDARVAAVGPGQHGHAGGMEPAHGGDRLRDVGAPSGDLLWRQR